MHGITRWSRFPIGALISLATACGQGPAATQPTPHTPTGPMITASPSPRVSIASPTVQVIRDVGGSLPNMGGRGPFFSNSGSGAFTFPNGTAPGSVSYVGAPIYDWSTNQPPATIGSGSFSVTVGGTTYTASGNAESIAELLDDPDTGTQYLLLGAWTLEVDPATGAEMGTVVYVLVPSSDFAPGATVAFDGYDRLAYFAYGDVNVEDPQIVAAAASGSITFGASGGLMIGDLLDATATGDFGEIEWQSQPPPPPTGTTTVAPGTYQLAFLQSAEVYCDGTLIGQESAFAGITVADIGIVEGVLDVAVVSATELDVTGTPVAAFGGTTVRLENTPDAPPGLYWTYAGRSGAGPASTNIYGAFLALDATQGPGVFGWAGLDFLTADEQGICEVAIPFELR